MKYLVMVVLFTSSMSQAQYVQPYFIPQGNTYQAPAMQYVPPQPMQFPTTYVPPQPQMPEQHIHQTRCFHVGNGQVNCTTY